MRIPVAIYVAPACAAWCRTLKNVFMHGKNLTRRRRKGNSGVWKQQQEEKDFKSKFIGSYFSTKQDSLTISISENRHGIGSANQAWEGKEGLQCIY